MAGCLQNKTTALYEDQGMSLLDEAFEEFKILNKIRTDDGYGGTKTEWVPGATVKGAMVYDASGQSMIAQALGSTSVYVLTVRKDLELDYHDVLRRESDNKIFRVTANSDEHKTPKSAGLNMRQYPCEEWVLTS